MRNRIFGLIQALESGSVVAFDQELELFVTVNNAQFTVWHTDSTATLYPFAVMPAVPLNGEFPSHTELRRVEAQAQEILEEVKRRFYDKAGAV